MSITPPSPEPTPAEFKGKSGPPIHALIALTLWLGSIHLIVLFILASFLLLPLPKLFLVLGMLVGLMFLPIDNNSKWGLALARYMYKHVNGYFPVTMYVEDIKAFNPDQAYVFGYEPHSVWPIGVGMLSDLTGFMPLTKIKFLASSALFYIPFMRHLWTWMGLTAVTRTNFLSLLKGGYSCIVVPGGMQETFYMNHHSEVAFLKTRKGFIRLAMEADCPVVPVFAFGQTCVYNWWMPRAKCFMKLYKLIKITPMIYWGTFWTLIPFRQPILVVVGKPIQFKKNCTPTVEEVSQVHDEFVEALQNLFDTHKTRAGYPDMELHIL